MQQNHTAIYPQVRSVYIARLIAKISNPCLLSVLFLLTIACTQAESVPAIFAWGGTMVLFLVGLPLGYIYLRFYFNHDFSNYKTDPTDFLRQHPRDIFVLGVLFGLPCVVALDVLNAPFILMCTLAALLVSAMIAAAINLYYHVSYHLSAITILVIMAAAAWGQTYYLLAAAIPVVGWAKYRIKAHSLAQIVLGVLLSIGISIAVLRVLG